MNETEIAIEKAKKEILKAISEKTNKVAISITSSVILATPVDTGRARSNWFVGINQPITKTTDKENYDKSGSTNITEGVNKISSTKGTVDKTIYISNNLPYIGRLNNGHSKQIQAGFIERSVEIAKGIK